MAIAAVTAALRSRLDRGLNAVMPGTLVTARPPDRARSQSGMNQVNLFLYQTTPNVAWRNMKTSAPNPPLALNLHYLLSVYGANDDDPESASHVLLAEAMKILHDDPLLHPGELRPSPHAGKGHRQAQRIRVTLQPVSVDELSKWWMMFQTPYRLSVSYEVSVVLLGEEPE
jgi:hypothetical protein